MIRLVTVLLWTLCILPVVITLAIIAVLVWFLCDPTNPIFGVQLLTK